MSETFSGEQAGQLVGHATCIWVCKRSYAIKLCPIQNIHPMLKWMPIKNSFESIRISPTNLVFFFFWLIIQKNFYSQRRLAGLILMHTKEFLIGSYLCTESMEVPLFLYQVKMMYLHQDFFLVSFFSAGQKNLKSEDKHEKSMIGFITNPCFQLNG